MNKNDCSSFVASFTSKKAKKVKYEGGNKVFITIIPVSETPDKKIEFVFNIKENKVLFVSNVEFEKQ